MSHTTPVSERAISPLFSSSKLSPTPVMPRRPEPSGKLRRRSVKELRVRFTQAAQARFEQLGLSRETRLPTDTEFSRVFDCGGSADRANGAELLRRFRDDDLELGKFIPGLSHPHVTARLAQSHCPRVAQDTIEAAEQIACGSIRLGARVAAVGARPDWALEPVSGKRTPATHWRRIPYLDARVAGDCKFTWELNRHQYFLTLGQAYVLTGDDRYAALISAHLSSWMDDNPPQIGINWTSSLELAFRAISWIWALALIRHSRHLTAPLYVRTLKYLYRHARHIERNLSTYFSPNTHLTGEALGLLYVGTAFPQFARALQWRLTGRRILAEQLDRQLFADGVYFEQSTSYHRYTTDFYLHAELLTKPSALSSTQDVEPRLHTLLDFLLHITRPDGSAPLIGDDDGGRLVMLGQRPANDFRDTLAIGAALAGRGDCAAAAGNEVDELIWLLGSEGLETYHRLRAVAPASTSRAFEDSGYFVMRERWDSHADWGLVRCGQHAPQSGAHAHADALAIEVSIAGRSMLVDSGTYVYTAAPADRDYFRSSAAHNTLTIDGASSAEPAASAFKWRSVPCSRTSAWESTATFDFFEGEHDGYLRLDSPAIHRRAVFFLKGEYWVLRDRVESEGEHRVALRLHWAPDVAVSMADGGVLRADARGSGTPVAASFFARHGRLSCEAGWVSTAFGTRQPASVSVFDVDSDETEDIVTLLGASRALRVDDCAWRPGSNRRPGLLRVATPAAIDTILTGPTDGADDPGIVSDAAWTWLRRSLDGELAAFAVVRGSTLRIDGAPLFETSDAVRHAVGRRDGDHWHVEVQPPSSSMRFSLARLDSTDEPCAASVE
jgi:Heparinase II/III-like protein/Heparinase II/III N-terminus